MDEVETAGELADLNLAQAIRRVREAPAEASVEGYCLSCFETLTTGRWCDQSCRDDWQRVRDASRHPRNIKPAPTLDDET